ncbi:LysR family substrate-binding domain-containing protein [Leptolyngbya sp. 7M]|uniref:LysR family substrate-binding domain-containing protein n=1 Tax=Leptolyngbya sp. 7M TaxID=2812896 RepID=UPI0021F198E5|nr:LysR family substrate-binding domain-containing protein [Leptolyngbya sp. 7M]
MGTAFGPALHITRPTPTPPQGSPPQIISLCQQAGFSPNVVQEAMQMQTIVSLVAGGIGISIVPVSLENMQRAGVVYKPLAEPTPCAEIAVAWRQNDHSPSIQRFLEIVNQVMALR